MRPVGELRVRAGGDDDDVARPVGTPEPLDGDDGAAQIAPDPFDQCVRSGATQIDRLQLPAGVMWHRTRRDEDTGSERFGQEYGRERSTESQRYRRTPQ